MLKYFANGQRVFSFQFPAFVPKQEFAENSNKIPTNI